MSADTIQEDQHRLGVEIARAKDYLSEFFNRLHRLDRTADPRYLKPTLDDFKYPALTIISTVTNDQPITPQSGELIGLLLDIIAENAAEATATTLLFSAVFSKTTLTIQIQNDGPPLPDEIQSLMSLGVSKNKDVYHTGIGLFLARLVIDSLNGHLRLNTRSKVDFTIEFPLESINSI